jgi:hypothetical protein
MTRATSSATAAKTSVAVASRATSVATRRSAACSSASRPTLLRASTLEIAVAISSANSPRPTSAPAGSASARRDAATTPHSRPSTRIGQPTEPRMPIARAVADPAGGAHISRQMSPRAQAVLRGTLRPSAALRERRERERHVHRPAAHAETFGDACFRSARGRAAGGVSPAMPGGLPADLLRRP